MKIGIVLPSVPAYSETFFTSKIEGLQANGFEVVLFVNHFSAKTKTSLNCSIVSSPKFSKNKLKNSFISLFCFYKALFFSYNSTRKLYLLDKKDSLSFAKRIKSIIINSSILTQKLDWLHFGFGTMAINRENVAEAIGAKLGVSFRGFDHYVYPLKNVDCYKILFSKKAKYHVLSESMKKDLMIQLIPEENIITITPAIDFKLFFNENKFENKPAFLTVARLHWIKGLDYILEAFSILNKKGFDFQYKIIGDGAEKERLQFLVHQLGLNNKVIFLGKLDHEEVKQEFLKTSYYIQYSHQEGFCNAVLEAQAMGKICIVSDADGLVENVDDNVTGFVVLKRNSEVLANKIETVFNLNLESKEILIEQAVKRIEFNFTIEKQKHQFVDFYKN